MLFSGCRASSRAIKSIRAPAHLSHRLSPRLPQKLVHRSMSESNNKSEAEWRAILSPEQVGVALDRSVHQRLDLRTPAVPHPPREGHRACRHGKVRQAL